jgi:hypothetical protein
LLIAVSDWIARLACEGHDLTGHDLLQKNVAMLISLTEYSIYIIEPINNKIIYKINVVGCLDCQLSSSQWGPVPPH